jgi:NAD(P)-dependent dehydrogenase (short-subunit alcohol dehydrogenase family)
VLLSFSDDDLPLYFAGHPDVATMSQQGPATPDHVIRTKSLPQIGRDVDAYQNAYRAYFAKHSPSSSQTLTMLDPAPRVILDAEWGLGIVGRTARETGIVKDIYRHTMEIILRAEALGGYRALPAQDLFDVEYWDLEQAKLRRGGAPPVFTGEIALVTGAASGIGRACATALMQRGAAVIGLDVNPGIVGQWDRPDFLGLQCDVTEPGQVEAALESGVKQYGGVDMVILNAGIFPPGRAIASMSLDTWRRAQDVNLDANLALLRELHPLLKQAPRSGRVVVVGSKNVPAPGPGVAAYSVSKAALVQLARVAALEWASDGIRVNVIHPNAVFDTGIWSEEVLQARAANYGLTVREYKSSNLLGVEITSKDVAEMVAEMCGPVFSKTTGAQVPLDGGNDRVI